MPSRAGIDRGAREQRPRLLLLTPDFPPARGGIQVLSARLAGGLSERFDTSVVTLADGRSARERAGYGCPVWRAAPFGGSGVGRIGALTVGGLREALATRPQVILSAHIVASPAAAIARAALGARVVQYFYAKEIGDKPRLARFAAARCDAAVSISSYTSALLAARGATPRRLRLIAPGVDLPDAPGRLPSQRPTFITISRLADRYKGHDVLVRALARVRERVPDVEWVVIGDGPLRSSIEAQAAELGVSGAIRFLGAISDEERNLWLRRSDLLAMPSRLPEGRLAGEGFGIVYLEAASYAKPVVAGNVAGALDAVIDGETGLLVDPTDAEAVADAIGRLLLDRELASRLGAAAARRAGDYAWPAVVDRVGEVIEEVLGG